MPKEAQLLITYGPIGNQTPNDFSPNPSVQAAEIFYVPDSNRLIVRGKTNVVATDTRLFSFEDPVVALAHAFAISRKLGAFFIYKDDAQKRKLTNQKAVLALGYRLDLGRYSLRFFNPTEKSERRRARIKLEAIPSWSEVDGSTYLQFSFKKILELATQLMPESNALEAIQQFVAAMKEKYPYPVNLYSQLQQAYDRFKLYMILGKVGEYYRLVAEARGRATREGLNHELVKKLLEKIGLGQGTKFSKALVDQIPILDSKQLGDLMRLMAEVYQDTKDLLKIYDVQNEIGDEFTSANVGKFKTLVALTANEADRVSELRRIDASHGSALVQAMGVIRSYAAGRILCGLEQLTAQQKIPPAFVNELTALTRVININHQHYVARFIGNNMNGDRALKAYTDFVNQHHRLR